jgi:hypothetical protein
MEGFFVNLHSLRSDVHDANLSEEDLIVIAHLVGRIHSDVLERIEKGSSSKRKDAYKKRPRDEKDEKCECGGKQKPAHYVGEDGKKVCHQCYRKFVKKRGGESVEKNP